MSSTTTATTPTAEPASAAATEWAAYMQTLAPLGERIVDMLPEQEAADPLLRREAYRKLYSTIAHAYFGAVYADPEYPDFIPYFNTAFDYLVANPDDTYVVSPLDSDGTYRISGHRGSVRILDFSVGSGTLVPRGTGPFGATQATYSPDDLEIAEDGTFEVVLSRARPEGHQGDWWELTAETTYILVRNRAYDWLNEQDARLAIERLDRPAARPRQSAEQIEARLEHVGEWAESWSKIWLGRDNDVVNELRVLDLDDLGGVANQAYWEGMFLLEPDEALILETELPAEVRYWNVQLGDPLWNAIDWVNLQSNLNGHTARLDEDGKFRAVVSAQDPGVPNWLDTGGYEKGYVFGRWTHASDYPHPTVEKVRVADVRERLPADTPAVSAEEREAALRVRRKGAQLRRRW